MEFKIDYFQRSCAVFGSTLRMISASGSGVYFESFFDFILFDELLVFFIGISNIVTLIYSFAIKLFFFAFVLKNVFLFFSFRELFATMCVLKLILAMLLRRLSLDNLEGKCFRFYGFLWRAIGEVDTDLLVIETNGVGLSWRGPKTTVISRFHIKQSQLVTDNRVHSDKINLK